MASLLAAPHCYLRTETKYRSERGREVALYVLLLLYIHVYQGLNPTAVCTMSLNISEEEKCTAQCFWLVAKEIPVMLLYSLVFLVNPPLPPVLANTELSSLFTPAEPFPATYQVWRAYNLSGVIGRFLLSNTYYLSRTGRVWWALTENLQGWRTPLCDLLLFCHC